MKEQNQQEKFISYPRELWSNYEEAINDILPYLFLSNRPGEVCPKYAVLKIMEKITPDEGGNGLFLFFLIHDKETEELEYMYSYPIETDLHVILHELIEAEILHTYIL